MLIIKVFRDMYKKVLYTIRLTRFRPLFVMNTYTKQQCFCKFLDVCVRR